jgi:hypothetical protein
MSTLGLTLQAVIELKLAWFGLEIAGSEQGS